jgi:hypothetical protein
MVAGWGSGSADLAGGKRGDPIQVPPTFRSSCRDSRPAGIAGRLAPPAWHLLPADKDALYGVALHFETHILPSDDLN